MVYREGTAGAKSVSGNEHAVFKAQKGQNERRGEESEMVLGRSTVASGALIRSFCFILRPSANVGGLSKESDKVFKIYGQWIHGG